MINLSGIYIVDEIEWRSDDPNLPLSHTFSVDMNDPFWKEHVEGYLSDCESPREALNEFLGEYLDKAYYTDILSYRVRSLEEVRDDKISIILKK